MITTLQHLALQTTLAFRLFPILLATQLADPLFGNEPEIDYASRLEVAIIHNDLEKLESLTKEIGEFDEIAIHNIPLLHYAVYANADKVVKWYIEKGGDLLTMDILGHYAGEIALQHEKLDIALLLKRDKIVLSEENLREYFSRTQGCRYKDDATIDSYYCELSWESVSPDEAQVEILKFHDNLLSSFFNCVIAEKFGYFVTTEEHYD